MEKAANRRDADTSPSVGRKFSIRFTVATLFFIATISTAVFAISLQFIFTKNMAQEHVLSKLSIAASEVSEYIQQMDTNAQSSVRILSNLATNIDHQFSEQEVREILIQVLKDNPLFYSIYIGQDNETFYQIINLNSSPIVRERIEAGAQDRWVVITIHGQGEERIRSTLYYTRDFELSKLITEPSNYYPTRRPWFNAARADEVFKTDPYLFKHLKITGQTYSMRSKDAVIGIDIVLSSIGSKLTASAMNLPLNSDVEAFVYRGTGDVVASNQARQTEVHLPQLSEISLPTEAQMLIDDLSPVLVSNQQDRQPYDYAIAGEPQGYSIALITTLAQLLGLDVEFVNGFNAEQLNRDFEKGNLDIIHSLDIDYTLQEKVGEKELVLFHSETAFIGFANRADLHDSKVGIVKGRGLDRLLKEYYPEAKWVEYETSNDAKKALTKRQVDYLFDTEQALLAIKHALSIPLHLHKATSEIQIPFKITFSKQSVRLKPYFEQALNQVTEEHRNVLAAQWFGQHMNNQIPYKKLLEITHQPQWQQRIVKENFSGVDKYVYVRALTAGEADKREFFAVVIDESDVMGEVYFKLYTTVGVSVLVLVILLPLAWLFGSPIVNPIKLLQKETQKIKRRQFDEVKQVKTHIKEVWQLSHSLSEMAAEIKRHEKQQEDFVEAFIKLIAQAIDDKSPYTAGHCNRVPEIGLMLAKAVEECDYGKFKDFKFANENERREFRIAAWLHDCGKITTPEHIVDKGTKLEANYNRIHEVRTRFEVLLRDAEIAHLKRVMSEAQSESHSQQIFNETREKLHQDFEFIARCNIGGEFMDEVSIARVHAISEQTWQRHFDDTLGLSPVEQLNRPSESQALPITEKLLSDKTEHIIPRDREMIFDPSLGIKMEVPQHQYNLGEIYNLSISRGTLTAEDRFKINEHIISGIKILESLPFPAELSRVPRYASTHHETLKGTGYPRKLTGDDLSTPERILVISDIFEALTASDRPYKKAKPLSVAIDIMYKMALDEHFDMELFQLFLRSGVYLEYAKHFLPAKQIDKVDIEKYFDNELAA